MKIGVITSAYPDYEDDPHGIFVHRLMKEIAKKGHEVHVLAPYTGGETEYTLEGVHVERFHYFYPRRFEKLSGRAGMIDNVKEGFLVKIQVLTFLFFNVIHSILKLRKMDVVHVQWPIPNGLGAIFLKKIYGIPYINTIHGEEVHLSKRYHLLFALRWLVNNSSKTITNSTATRKFCLEAGLDGDKIDVIPFGVDTDFFRPLEVYKDENIFQILSVGYLIERKGFEYLIRAMPLVLEKHNQARLKIVGSGPLESKLKELIYELDLGDEVEIVKNVSDEELLMIYNSSDLFVLPSIVDSQGNTEGLGVVLLEAMACGLPVIGSDVGGIPDVINEKWTGFLVRPKNIQDLFNNITYLIENGDIKEKVADSGNKKVKVIFNWNSLSNQYLWVYREIVKNEVKV
ncbi:glycosyltransferase [Methanobacterium formicicum]|jgi:glycosyltransferase involved in cell wall biosynthesis|uniref:Group 1 glycosyl transferase n=1 Tax=Methanobacterium formicicum TaxID=2162 RepID=A0A0S4FQ20_METFO|nr:glycosyltransferase [Methanobacterium formicicum]CEL25138.1 group 1 glycosyl transferase [Methanobacterium formicicum]